MLEQITLGAAIGVVAGFLTGLSIAINSRDGIWPLVWGYLMLFGGLAGASLGVVHWATH